MKKWIFSLGLVTVSGGLQAQGNSTLPPIPAYPGNDSRNGANFDPRMQDPRFYQGGQIPNNPQLGSPVRGVPDPYAPNPGVAPSYQALMNENRPGPGPGRMGPGGAGPQSGPPQMNQGFVMPPPGGPAGPGPNIPYPSGAPQFGPGGPQNNNRYVEVNNPGYYRDPRENIREMEPRRRDDKTEGPCVQLKQVIVALKREADYAAGLQSRMQQAYKLSRALKIVGQNERPDEVKDARDYLQGKDGEFAARESELQNLLAELAGNLGIKKVENFSTRSGNGQGQSLPLPIQEISLAGDPLRQDRRENTMEGLRFLALKNLYQDATQTRDRHGDSDQWVIYVHKYLNEMNEEFSKLAGQCQQALGNETALSEFVENASRRISFNQELEEDDRK